MAIAFIKNRGGFVDRLLVYRMDEDKRSRI